jgi:hypothetical protein
VSVYPLSLLGNGSVNVPLSLLENGYVKISLSLLGNGSVETLPRDEYTSNNRRIVGRVVFNVAGIVSRKVNDWFFSGLLVFLNTELTCIS